MSEKIDPNLLRLRIALRGDLDSNPDHFSELIEAMLATSSDDAARSALQAAIAHQFSLAPSSVRDWALGASMATPSLRRRVVTYIRGRAKELGVEED